MDLAACVDTACAMPVCIVSALIIRPNAVISSMFVDLMGGFFQLSASSRIVKDPLHLLAVIHQPLLLNLPGDMRSMTMMATSIIIIAAKSLVRALCSSAMRTVTNLPPLDLYELIHCAEPCGNIELERQGRGSDKFLKEKGHVNMTF